MKSKRLVYLVIVISTIDFFHRTVFTKAESQSPESRLLEIDKHPAWEALDKLDCGETFTDRIIGGEEAALGQHPWIARLGYMSHGEGEDEGTEEVEYKCGGVLISEWIVLTAAHCVVNLDPGVQLTTVRLGEHDVRTDPDCRVGVCAPPVQDFKVKSITPHGKFNNPAFSNDIAVVELDHAAHLTDFVVPVCLPHGPLILLPLLNEVATVAGWGITNMTTRSEADALQTLQIPVIPLSRCFEFAKKVTISDLQVCAGGQSKKDSCAGDSGGPLVKIYETDDGPRTYVVGVVSFGAELCGYGKPGVYTSVFKYMSWILDHVMRDKPPKTD